MQVDRRPDVWVASPTTWDTFNFRSNLITKLLQQGYRVTAYSPRDAYVKRVTALGARFVHLAIRNDGINPLKESLTFLRVVATLLRERPALILTFAPKVNIYVSLAAAVAGVPVIANVSGLGRAFIVDGWLKVVSRLLYRLALRRQKKVFFQNDDDFHYFIDTALVDAACSARLPGSGVDLRRFRPVAERPPGDEFVFLLAGRLMWDKGVGEFVEAARVTRARFRRAKFRLLGFIGVDNPSSIPRAQVQQWEDEGLVEYLGVTDDVDAVFATVDCVVLPSYREGVPRILLEAAGMAIPVIATDASGCRDTVDHEVTGFLCKVADAGDLARQMCRMLELSPQQRRAMGMAGRHKMEREFDERIIIERNLQAVREALRDTAAARSPAAP